LWVALKGDSWLELEGESLTGFFTVGTCHQLNGGASPGTLQRPGDALKWSAIATIRCIVITKGWTNYQNDATI
jgi:hypothetical protein